ncbi:SAGA-associated factor 11 [Candida viswanathii]|uniref:SAGA-associated factor 11 n=1 Tax=Candida viswanathii TaxID=5486 RepID=A0A367YEQ6_9ASCO|nr:SAGA-associated factor 11 [Candida viswanathii]
MTDSPITYQTLAESILDDLLNNIIKQTTLNSLTNRIPAAPSKEFIEQDKVKMKQVETSKYWACNNCGRNIAGVRFALHINKCLDRKRK